MTRVSVGLPVYNAERYLDEALSSLLAQTHEDLEIIISDNASTDATPEICAQYASADPRIVYMRQPVNRGAAANHNAVVNAASGPYFRWYAYDDRLHPRCIESCAAALDADKSAILAWPWTVVIDASGRETCRYATDLPWDNTSPITRLTSLLEPRPSLLHMCYPVYGVMRLDVLRATRLLGTNPGADTVLLTELALRGPWVQVPEWLFINRRHAGSSAIDKTPEQIAVWFDTRASPRTNPTPQLALLVGYVIACLIAPLPLVQRLKCLMVALRWGLTERRPRVILGELRLRARDELRQVLSSRARGDYPNVA